MIPRFLVPGERRRRRQADVNRDSRNDVITLAGSVFAERLQLARYGGLELN